MECLYVTFINKDRDLECHRVGVGGVNKILKYEYSPEPHCTKYYIEVFIENKLAMELHEFNIVGYV